MDGDRIPVEARLSVASHQASYKMGSEFLPGGGGSGRGVALNTHLRLVPRLKQE